MDEPSPRFRQNLIASVVEAEGVPCVDVRDPETGTSFRFYDFEYQLALQLNGQPIDEVTAWASATYGVDLTADGVAEFAGRLAELGFLEPAGAPPRASTGADEGRDDGVSHGGAFDGAPADAASSDAPEHPTAAEWTDGAKTATFVPDVSMLDRAADLTPVAPHLPGLYTPPPTAPPTTTTTTTTTSGSAEGSNGVTTPAEAKGEAPPAEADKTPVPEPTPVPQRTAVPTAAPPRAAAAVAEAVAAKGKETEKEPEKGREVVRSVAVTRPAEAPTIPSLPSNISASGRGPQPPPSPAPPLAAASPAMPSPPGLTPPPAGLTPTPVHGSQSSGPGRGLGQPAWAAALDGPDPRVPPSSGASAPPFGLAPASGGDVAQTPPSALPKATPAPPGLPERRQPPTPEAVVMAGFDEPVAAETGKSPARLVALVLVAVLAVAVIGFLIWRSQAPVAPQAVRVRVLSPKPTAVYRWFSRPGRVLEHETRTVGFGANGRVAEISPPGTEFAAGEILGRLHGAAALETMLTHHRSRLAYYQQMRESMQAAGNAPELRQAEIKYADKQRLVDETLASLAPLVVRAAEPGEVTEALSKVGTFLKAGAPVVRLAGRLLHGELDIEPEELADAQALDFCRVEVIGLGPRAAVAPPRRGAGAVTDSGSPDAQDGPRFIDCQLPAARPKVPGRMRVGLPADLGLVPGQPVRLARHRYDAVFPIPASALNVAGERRTVWIAARSGIAEERDVTVVELGEEALVSDGIALHEDVILEAPPDLRAGTRVVGTR